MSEREVRVSSVPEAWCCCSRGAYRSASPPSAVSSSLLLPRSFPSVPYDPTPLYYFHYALSFLTATLSLLLFVPIEPVARLHPSLPFPFPFICLCWSGVFACQCPLPVPYSSALTVRQWSAGTLRCDLVPIPSAPLQPPSRFTSNTTRIRSLSPIPPLTPRRV